eukprot:822130_1
MSQLDLSIPNNASKLHAQYYHVITYNNLPLLIKKLQNTFTEDAQKQLWILKKMNVGDNNGCFTLSSAFYHSRFHGFGRIYGGLNIINKNKQINEQILSRLSNCIKQETGFYYIFRFKDLKPKTDTLSDISFCDN